MANNNNNSRSASFWSWLISIPLFVGTVSESGTTGLGVRYRTPGHAYEECLGGPVVCETTTDKYRGAGPYLHVYVVTVILPTKTCVEVSLCFVICIYFYTIETSISLYKRYKIFNGQEWKNITRYNFYYFICFIFIFLNFIFSIRPWIKVCI